MATTDFTNSVTLTDAAWFDDVDGAAYSVLTGVAGTNTITATGPATYSYSATRVPVWFIPAVTNTGATTINVTPSGGSALGAKNIFANGAACAGGELVAGVPCAVIYDGTQFNIIGMSVAISQLTEDASPDAANDVVVTYDASAKLNKKVKLQNIAGTAATQADQETATSTTTNVTPGRQHFHPSAPKAWGLITHATTVTTSYPAAGVSNTNPATGQYVVTHGLTFSSANYAVVVTPVAGSTAAITTRITARNSTTFTVLFEDGGTGADVNVDAFSYICMGDL